jgi:hypothetical protein
MTSLFFVSDSKNKFSRYKKGKRKKAMRNFEAHGMTHRIR